MVRYAPSSVVRGGGLCEAVSKMWFGNMLGFTFDKGISRQELFAKEYGAIVLEVTDTASLTGLIISLSAR